MNQIKSVFCFSTHFSQFLFSISILSLLLSQCLSIITKNVLQVPRGTFSTAGCTFDLQKSQVGSFSTRISREPESVTDDFSFCFKSPFKVSFMPHLIEH